MLLIHHCRRNSATGTSGGLAFLSRPLACLAPHFWYTVDRPIFTLAHSSGFGTNHASQWRIAAKAAILLSYFLFNSHQAIVYRINTRQLRRAVAVKEGRGRSDPRHPVTRNHNRAIFLPPPPPSPSLSLPLFNTILSFFFCDARYHIYASRKFWLRTLHEGCTLKMLLMLWYWQSNHIFRCNWDNSMAKLTSIIVMEGTRWGYLLYTNLKLFYLYIFWSK